MNIMLITRTLTTFVRTTVDLELAMNSVERVDYYTSYSSNGAWVSDYFQHNIRLQPG